jgi:hypothetical protein
MWRIRGYGHSMGNHCFRISGTFRGCSRVYLVGCSHGRAAYPNCMAAESRSMRGFAAGAFGLRGGLLV